MSHMSKGAASQSANARETDSKEMVLNSAQALIMEHGFTGLSMRELARHSGIAKGTIYHHFQDKREIYLTVLERDIDFVRDRLVAVVDAPAAVSHGVATAGQSARESAVGPLSQNNFLQKLRALIRVYFELQRERRLVIMLALRESSSIDDKFGEIIKKYRTKLLQPISSLIRKGIDDGEVRPIDVDLAVLSLLGILQSFVIHQLILEDSDIDEAAIDHIVKLLAEGMSAHPLPGEPNGN